MSKKNRNQKKTKKSKKKITFASFIKSRVTSAVIAVIAEAFLVLSIIGMCTIESSTTHRLDANAS